MTFQGFNEISRQKISTMDTGCILKNGDLTQFFMKIGAETISFVCNNVRWKQRIRKSLFCQARYLLTKLCNIFDEAFLFDVSIHSFCKNDIKSDFFLEPVWESNNEKHDGNIFFLIDFTDFMVDSTVNI